MPCVDRAIALARPYRQVGREARRGDTIVRVGDVPIGGEHFAVIAGPCAVEGEEQLRAIATAVRDAGAAILRGGAFKPRTSPYSFQGLGEEGLAILRAVADELELAVVTEALDPRHVEAVARRADAIQIGSRNSQNFPLLTEVGKVGKPILLKRGMAQTLKELLLAAEYVLNAGAPGVILCERGVRTFDTETRHLLDLGAVPALQAMSHLPVIVDPSHATGRAELVAPLAKAAVAAGANGLLVEVHSDPTVALSDGRQALRPAEFAELMERVERLRALELGELEMRSDPITKIDAGRRS
jgi:3-deoxy-7-phosphoheptulonate synthase